MRKENAVSILWGECKDIFLSSSNQQLEDLLKNALNIVRKYDAFFRKKADLEFLNYIIKMNADEYIIGTNGDDFEILTKTYIRLEGISVEIIWQILSQLIWDLTVPVTNKICPFCRCDNVVLLADKEKKHLYESCENCFGTAEDGIRIMRPDNLFPASKDMVEKHYYSFLNNGSI